MNCKYCDQKAAWINPYNNAPLCGLHAQQKMEQLRKELNQPLADTPKDWFLKIVESDPESIGASFNVKTRSIIRRK